MGARFLADTRGVAPLVPATPFVSVLYKPQHEIPASVVVVIVLAYHDLQAVLVPCRSMDGVMLGTTSAHNHVIAQVKLRVLTRANENIPALEGALRRVIHDSPAPCPEVGNHVDGAFRFARVEPGASQAREHQRGAVVVWALTIYLAVTMSVVSSNPCRLAQILGDRIVAR